MRRSPPLRFLAIVIGGWAALRTAVVAPLWTAQPAGAVSAAVASRPRPAPRPGPAAEPVRSERASGEDGRISVAAAEPPPRRAERGRPPPVLMTSSPASSQPPSLPRHGVPLAVVPPVAATGRLLPAEPALSTASRRWSLSAWAFVRSGASAPLAAGGLLGGSQAGARLAFRLNADAARPLALSFRLSAPLRRARGAEAAVGIDWRPARRLPVHLLAERRQALGREGRSAFALTVYGGVADSRLGPFRIDAYAQAGMVGARSRDAFADGSARISLPMGERVRLGAGAWAAAQPGLARLDLGPQAALRLPVAGRSVTVAADWRVRVAGDAEPGSGPTLTVATDF